MMRRSLVASVALAVFTAVLAVHAQDTSKGKVDPPQITPGKDGKLPTFNEKDLAKAEKLLGDQFSNFEKSLLILQQRLANSGNAADKQRAEQLKTVLDTATGLTISQKFAQFVKYLNNQPLGDTQQIAEAVRQSKALTEGLKQLLDLLKANDVGAKSKEERLALEKFVKDLEKVIRDQKLVRSQIGTNPDKQAVGDDQNAVTKKTEGLEDKLGPKGGNTGEAKETKGTAKEGGAGKKGEGKDLGKDGEGKPGDAKNPGKDGEGAKTKPKEGGQGDPKGGAKDPKAGDKAGDQAGKGKDGKGGEASSKKDGQGDGKAKDGGDKAGDKGGAKGGDKAADKAGGAKSDKGGEASKAGDSKKGDGAKAGGDSKAGDPKGDSKQGEAKAGSDSKSQGGAKSSGQGGGDAQAGGGKSDNQPPPPGGKMPDPKDSIQITKQKIQDAIENQKKAEDNIAKGDPKEAGTDADKAIADLEAAKKKLEDLIRQLREEELERVLAALINRCQKMLAMQEEVLRGTLRVQGQIQAIPGGKADRVSIQDSLNLSDDELKIVVEATKAIEMLETEGSAIAFPEVFQQVREDMKHVQRRLKNTDVGDVTVVIEQDIIETLKEMIKALEKAKKDLDDKKNPPKPPSGDPPPPPQDQKLLEKIAELKMLKAMQLRVNSRTELYAKRYPGLEQAQAEDIRIELRELAGRQERIYDVTRQMAQQDQK